MERIERTIFFWAPLFKWYVAGFSVSFTVTYSVFRPGVWSRRASKTSTDPQRTSRSRRTSRSQLPASSGSDTPSSVRDKGATAIAVPCLDLTMRLPEVTPVNYSLAAVNAFVGATGGYQLFRAVK